MDYKIKGNYEVSEMHEFSMDWNGFNFLIVYGKHKTGWFIAVPNWKVCSDIGTPEDESYNVTKLARTTLVDNAPLVIAKAVKEHWESSYID